MQQHILHFSKRNKTHFANQKLLFYILMQVHLFYTVLKIKSGRPAHYVHTLRKSICGICHDPYEQSIWDVRNICPIVGLQVLLKWSLNSRHENYKKKSTKGPIVGADNDLELPARCLYSIGSLMNFCLIFENPFFLSVLNPNFLPVLINVLKDSYKAFVKLFK